MQAVEREGERNVCVCGGGEGRVVGIEGEKWQGGSFVLRLSSAAVYDYLL